MQGRYGARLVQADRYLLQLSRYLHLNPVRTKEAARLTLPAQVERLRQYRWSSYRSYIGEEKAPEFLTERSILEQVGGRGSGQRQRQRYAQLVEAGLAESDEELKELLRGGQRGVGSKTFQAELARRHEERLRQAGQREDAAFRRPGRKVTVAQVEAVVAEVLGIDPEGFRRQRKGGWERALLAKELVEQAGMTQREAARGMGLTTGAAVSIQLRRLQQVLPQEADLQKQVRQIEARLNNLFFKG